MHDPRPPLPPAPLSVLTLMFSRGRGGIERAFLDGGAALAAQGCAVHYLVDDRAAILPECVEACATRQHGTAVHTLRQYGGWDLRAAYRLRQLAARLRPDVILCHGNRAILLAQRAGLRPKIGFVHNYHLQHLHRCQGVVAVTGALRDLAQLRTGLPCVHVPNMVRIPLEGTGGRDSAGGGLPAIGAMGRLEHKKGMDIWLHALACLRQEGVAFRAVLGGDGPERPALLALRDTLKLTDTVDMPGWVADTTAFFRTLDVFCVPSRHEPFGIVLLEAFAHGVPVITSASEGATEILGNGPAALPLAPGVAQVVPVDDAAALARAMADCLQAPQRAQAMATAAYTHVRAHYTPDVVGPRMLAALHHLRAAFHVGGAVAAPAEVAHHA